MTEFEKSIVKLLNLNPKHTKIAKDLGYTDADALYEDVIYNPEGDALQKAIDYSASKGVAVPPNGARAAAIMGELLYDKVIPAIGNHMPRSYPASSVSPYYDALRLHGLDRSLNDNEFWNSLSLEEKLALSSDYETKVNDARNLWGMFGLLNTYELDEERLLSDLKELSKIKQFDLETPLYSDIEDSVAAQLNPYYDDARARALESFNDRNTALDEALALTQQSYNDQFKNMNDLYNRSASNVLSNQYMSNAQTFDALQSDMRKSRQNALEAGASAGIRLAGNVNTLLTAQNKQSATAMDTSNALAEMLLQQRNAASGLRSDYNQYMSNYKLNKADNKSNYNSALTSIDTDYRNELSDRTDTRYNRELADYNTAEEKYSNQFTNLYNQGNMVAPKYENYLHSNRNK